MVNPGDNLKVQQAYEKNPGHLQANFFPDNCRLALIVLWQKELRFLPNFGFCVFALKIYREIINKEKGQ